MYSFIEPQLAAENIMLKNIAQSIDPTAYGIRLKESEEEKATWSSNYPIFYYNNTLFPLSSLNLHLFEPRYRTMMNRILDSTRAFAYVPNFTGYHAKVGELALVANVKNAESSPSGTWFISCQS